MFFLSDAVQVSASVLQVLIPCLHTKQKTPERVLLFWRRARDSNPRVGFDPLHDFQSCSFGQLGQLSVFNALLLYINKTKNAREKLSEPVFIL